MSDSPPSPLPLRRNRDFVLLWAGQSVSEVGSQLTVLALPLVALVVLKASPFRIGLLAAASTSAFLVIALPAGVVVDRFADHRRLMLWCDVARLVLIGSIPVAQAAGVLTLAQLYVVALLTSCFTVFFTVAYQSLLPSLVDRDQLTEGNGKLGTSASAAQIAGPGLGAALVGLVGPAKAMTGDAISYALSAGTLAATVCNVSLTSYRQATCPPELLGRVSAAARWVNGGTLPLGGIAGGALATAVGVRTTLWIAVVGGCLSGLWLFFSPLRGLRDIPRDVPALATA